MRRIIGGFLIAALFAGSPGGSSVLAADLPEFECEPLRRVEGPPVAYPAESRGAEEDRCRRDPNLAWDADCACPSGSVAVAASTPSSIDEEPPPASPN